MVGGRVLKGRRPLITSVALLIAFGTATPQSLAAAPQPWVAKVGRHAIGLSEFTHLLSIYRLSVGLKRYPVAAPGTTAYRRCHARHLTDNHCLKVFRRGSPAVMSMLLSAEWIKGEAKARRIGVARREVDREFTKSKRITFKSAAAYRKFMRDSGQTVADIRGRIAVALLSSKIQASVVKGVATADRDAKLTAFVEQFQSRWRARTVCAAAFAIDICHPLAPDVVTPTPQSLIGNLTTTTDMLSAPQVPPQLGPAPTTITADDIVKGTGTEALPGSTVTVRYVGVLRSNGTQFDSSWTRQPNSSRFPLSGLIKCWGKGIPGMRVGGRRQLTCPASSAYGASGSPPKIPPNAPLVFVVDLVAVG